MKPNKTAKIVIHIDLTRTRRLAFAAVAAVALCYPGWLIASNVGSLTTFAPGTPVRAAEVNGNFTAVRVAIDDNHAKVTQDQARISGLEGAVASKVGKDGAGNVTVAGNLTVVGNLNARMRPDWDSGWRVVASNGTYAWPHSLGGVPTQLMLQQCGAVSGSTCTSRVVLAGTGGRSTSGFDINPVSVTADTSLVHITMTNWWAWGYWEHGKNWHYSGYADLNPSTAFYRVFAWK